MGNLSITIFFYINKNEEPFFLALKKNIFLALAEI